MSDNVNHPEHYCQGGIECIDALKAATVGKTGIEAVCVANVIKYLWRFEKKNGIEDVRKARFYIDRLIQELELKHVESLEHFEQKAKEYMINYPVDPANIATIKPKNNT